MTPIRSIVCGLLVPVALAAQAPAAFEVASIRPSAEQAQQANIGVHIDGAQVRITYFALRDYIAMAYRVPTDQIVGPDWLGQARFDIAAKFPDNASSAQVSEMLQTLLADRFELKMHRDSKDFPIYALAIGRGGLKLQESPASKDEPAAPGTVNVGASGSAAGLSMDLGGGSFFSLANNRLEIKKAAMSTVAATLTRLMDRPVVDATGLTGFYDLAFDLTPEDYGAILIRSAVKAGVVLPPQALRALDAAVSDPFSGPLEKFGLRLESRKSPLDVIVVDSMRKTPTEN